MNSEKLIVIGCDDTVSLSNILNGVKGVAFPHSTISATRTSDLVRVVNAMEPELVILCFRNNQHILNDFGIFVKKVQLPIICLTNRFETEILSWNENSIVFTYSKEYLTNEAYLSSRINSIFLLNKNSPAAPEEQVTAPIIDPPKAQEYENVNLSRYVMELDQKVEVLAKVKERIAVLYPQVNDSTRAELTAIVSTIKSSVNDKHLWNDFKLYFEKTDPRFLLFLAQKYPALTPIDLKYCCYLKMNMSNDDIRNLLGINQESVRTHKYRLKKKMALAKDQDLRGYLRTVK